jgi:hypothetical protein
MSSGLEKHYGKEQSEMRSQLKTLEVALGKQTLWSGWVKQLEGLQDYLERNEPIPFIVDDILIKFDDDRAVPALGALEGLSEQTQVIFFTHHRHLLELDRKNVDASVLIEHTLIA